MRSFWVAVDRLSPLLAVLALLVPFLGVLVRLVLSRRRATPSGVRRGALTGMAGGVLLSPVLLWLAVCGPPAGRGAAAEAAYRRAAPVIAALDRYRRARGTYPRALAELAPEFLSYEAVSTLRVDSRDAFAYESEPTDYRLTFAYDGPGRNHCTYRATAPRWSCGGYW